MSDSSAPGVRRDATEALDLRLNVNGENHVISVEPRRILADVLRDELDLRSVHLGCEHGSCGACTVLVDGEPAASCVLLAAQVEGRRIETLEGLALDATMRALQTAFHEKFALQCGYCTPGMLVNLCSMLRRQPKPSEGEIRERLNGNLCRCTGYQPIVDAALFAASAVRDEMEASG